MNEIHTFVPNIYRLGVSPCGQCSRKLKKKDGRIRITLLPLLGTLLRVFETGMTRNRGLQKTKKKGVTMEMMHSNVANCITPHLFIWELW